MVIIDDNFWPDDISDELKNAIITRQPASDNFGLQVKTYNIRCLDPRFSDALDSADDYTEIPFAYVLFCGSPENYVPIGTFVFAVTDKDCEMITSENYQEYADVQFEISMP